ncbi:MAG: hypothetical protein CSA95_01880 [Bacteroidetes bacterium]|nr:MAG: hypothetical protein CSA95_01880 [Bacteroidota bacterium]
MSKSDKRQKQRKFPGLPSYPGGKKAFSSFISTHLRYPQEALREGIEGDVYVHYRINERGEVAEAKVTKGIGYGCDEEALRVVKMLKFGGARNRGLRVSISHKTRIKFRISQANGLSYSYIPAEKKKESTASKAYPQNAPSPGKYEYSITVEKKTF